MSETKVILQSPFTASVETFEEINSKEKNRCLKSLIFMQPRLFFYASFPAVNSAVKCRLSNPRIGDLFIGFFK